MLRFHSKCCVFLYDRPAPTFSFTAAPALRSRGIGGVPRTRGRCFAAPATVHLPSSRSPPSVRTCDIIQKHRKSLIFIDFYWISLIFIDFHWFSLVFIDFHWFSWIFIDFHSFLMIFYDWPWAPGGPVPGLPGPWRKSWKFMKINENKWKSMKINENQWKSMKINENQ